MFLVDPAGGNFLTERAPWKRGVELDEEGREIEGAKN